MHKPHERAEGSHVGIRNSRAMCLVCKVTVPLKGEWKNWYSIHLYLCLYCCTNFVAKYSLKIIVTLSRSTRVDAHQIFNCHAHHLTFRALHRVH